MLPSPCVGCAPGWRRSRWWQTGSGHAAAAHGSPCGSGSAVSGDPRPDAGERLTHPPFHKHLCYCCSCQRTSCHHPHPHSPVDATVMCTSPGHQTLKEREVNETYWCSINENKWVFYRRGKTNTWSNSLREVWSASYLGCWCLLSQLRSHCDHKSHNPDPGDPPAPAYWPAGPMSLLQRHETDNS